MGKKKKNVLILPGHVPAEAEVAKDGRDDGHGQDDAIHWIEVDSQLARRQLSPRKKTPRKTPRKAREAGPRNLLPGAKVRRKPQLTSISQLQPKDMEAGSSDPEELTPSQFDRPASAGKAVFFSKRVVRPVVPSKPFAVVQKEPLVEEPRNAAVAVPEAVSPKKPVSARKKTVLEYLSPAPLEYLPPTSPEKRVKLTGRSLSHSDTPSAKRLDSFSKSPLNGSRSEPNIPSHNLENEVLDVIPRNLAGEMLENEEVVRDSPDPVDIYTTPKHSVYRREATQYSPTQILDCDSQGNPRFSVDGSPIVLENNLPKAGPRYLRFEAHVAEVSGKILAEDTPESEQDLSLLERIKRHTNVNQKSTIPRLTLDEEYADLTQEF